ncbi:MAG: hypothetical protein HKN28_03245 [Alphaproteobacteria bacterium]|nr:hypothetical protein [Alphaproteobacteria bacterium]
MLEALRQASKGWTMKIILGLLALTFVVFFGSSDFGGGGHGGGHNAGRNANAVVEIDNLDFSLRQVGNEFNTQIQQISQANGQQIDPTSPFAGQILNQAISTIVTRSLFDVAARDLGVSASDAAVEQAIRNIGAFQDANGEFDSAAFAGYLRNVGQSEATFIANARDDLRRSQYLGTLRRTITPPEAMVDAVYKYRFERRTAELATIGIVTVEGLVPPDETQLLQFYEENKESFRAPETREATVASLTMEEFAATIEIDDQEVAEVYADRLANFQRGERREILQGIFLDQEGADKAAEMIAQGRPFAETVEELAGFPPVPMGTLQRTQITEPELAEAAFSAIEGSTAGPIETALGWQLLSIAKVFPEETIPLSDVSDRLRQAIALEQARDDMFDLLNAVEDGLAGGGTLEEVARDNGLTLQKLGPFNAGGLVVSGQPVAFEPLAGLVNAVFTTDVDEIADLVETENGGFFVARTDSITPPQIEPLERIRDTLTAAWLDRERLTLAIERGTDLADRARAGANFEELAKEIGAAFETTQPFDRTGLGSTISGSLITPLFQAAVGDIVLAQTQNGVGVARLLKIDKVTDGGDDFEREDLRAELAEGINRDISRQLTAALRDRYSIDVDRETIEQNLLP